MKIDLIDPYLSTGKEYVILKYQNAGFLKRLPALFLGFIVVMGLIVYKMVVDQESVDEIGVSVIVGGAAFISLFGVLPVLGNLILFYKNKQKSIEIKDGFMLYGSKRIPIDSSLRFSFEGNHLLLVRFESFGEIMFVYRDSEFLKKIPSLIKKNG